MTDRQTSEDIDSGQLFVAFDTETTGLWAPVNRIVELGAVKFRLGKGLVDSFQTLVNPQKKIPEDVIEIHGITDDDVRNAPTAAEILPRFRQFCGPDSILIAHNAPFDISFVGSELRRTDQEFGDNPILDTADIYRRFFPGMSSYSLISLSRHFGFAEKQEHRAVGDARLVMRLFELAAAKTGLGSGGQSLDRLVSVYTMKDWDAEQAELPREFNDLNRARRDELSVRIVYITASREPTTRVIRPYQFYRLGEVFYINAWCERARAERTFRLDRIEDYRVLD